MWSRAQPTLVTRKAISSAWYNLPSTPVLWKEAFSLGGLFI